MSENIKNKAPVERFVTSERCSKLRDGGVFSGFSVEMDMLPWKERLSNAFLGEIDEAFEEHCLVELLKRAGERISPKIDELLHVIDEITDLNAFARQKLKKIILDRLDCEIFLKELPKDVRTQFLESKQGERFVYLNGLHYDDEEGLNRKNIEDAFERFCFKSTDNQRVEVLTKFRKSVAPADWSLFVQSSRGEKYGTTQARYGLDASISKDALEADFKKFMEDRKAAVMGSLDEDFRQEFLASHEYLEYMNSMPEDLVEQLDSLKRALSGFQTRQALVGGLDEGERIALEELGVNLSSASLDDIDTAIDDLRGKTFVG